MPTPPLSRAAAAIGQSVFADLAPHIEAYLARGGDLIALHIGDTHRAPPEDARFERVVSGGYDASLYRYGPIDALGPLREACAAFLKARGRFPSPLRAPSNLLVGSGATHALFCAIRSVVDPGDEVLLAAPYWPLSIGILRASGAHVVEVPLTPRLYASPSLDAGEIFRAAVTERTRAIYLISPNNPDGKVLSRKHLSQILSLAEERDLWVIADEVYADYVYDGEHVPFVSLPGAPDRTIAAYSFSKSHALAGARVGLVVAPEAVVRAALRVSTHSVFNVPVVAQRLALEALQSGDAWMAETVRDYRETRDAVVAALVGAPLEFSAPEGGSYVFVDFARLIRDRHIALRDVLAVAVEHGVLLAPGGAFGEAYRTCARLCFTSEPRDRVLEGVARLRRALSTISAPAF